MSTIANCLRHIEKVKRVVAGEDAAYVARSRLGRLTLNLNTLLSGALSIPAPDRPSRLVAPDLADENVRTLVTLCNRLNDTAKTITQPSEPLDERWRSGWATLLRELDELERKLQSMNNQPL